MRILDTVKKMDLEKVIPKIYLTLSLLLGICLSIGLPFFNEPDGVYHYVNSCNIVNKTNDITVYGENSKWFGDQFSHQKPSYQKGDYFNKYFATQVQLMSRKKLPRSSEYPSITSYNFWGHLIPGIGVWVGFHIYPSMGVMIVVARLFTMLVYTICMYLIIRKLDRGKLFFALVGLSPVVMNTFSSLSYDGLSIVLSSLLVSVAINFVNREKISRRVIVIVILASLFSLVAMKTNVKLMLLLIPLVLVAYFMEKRLATLKALFSKIYIKLVVVAIFLLACVGSMLFLQRYGGVGTVVYRFLINFCYNFHPNINVLDVNSIFVQPLATHNMMPFWLTSAWFLMIFLTLFVEKKFVRNSLISWLAVFLFILNVVAVYLGFFTGYETGRKAILGAVGGVQGRYVTPFFFLLLLFSTNVKCKLKVLSYNTVAIMSFILVVISNSLLLFDTLFHILKS